ncbi:MAG: GWxTD domain-containing protein, partial [Candidatus Eisenbacteria bacterium]|nr:GWxTD domain-containing protein [Candidatus Eisenbacteria bacterium]
MTLRHCVRLVLLTLALVLAAPAPPVRAVVAPTAVERREREASDLARRAQLNLQRGRLEERRRAVAQLERATLLAPGNAEYQLMLARAYWRSGYRRAAMKRFERVVALRPGSADARYGLGQVWRRDWLKYLEKSSLDHAIRELVAAVRLDSTHTDSWLMLSSLLVARGDSVQALGAANGAMAVAPERLESRIARAACLWRTGDVERADSLFRDAVPRLDRPVRERFEDIAPVASERDTMIYNRLGAPERREFARQFWTEHDPDLATEANEAQLEYWARVTQAYFLFYDPKHREWDERGEVYVRYGPPEGTDYNPLGANLYSRGAQSAQMMFPMNVLVWKYPGLGMTVTMQDRVLSEYYLLPVSYDRDMDPRPQPDSIEARDALGTHEFRGVFPTLPPGVQRLPLRGLFARFVEERASGATGANLPRLFAAVELAAGPGEDL